MKYGSTNVRVGTLIFGERDMKKMKPIPTVEEPDEDEVKVEENGNKEGLTK